MIALFLLSEVFDSYWIHTGRAFLTSILAASDRHQTDRGRPVASKSKRVADD